MREPTRQCHANAMRLLEMADPEFMEGANCLFSGGTRLALELGEHRNSIDVDLMCFDASGWGAIRSGVTNNSLGPIFKTSPKLLRDVRAGRDAIRTFVQVNGMPVKLEIIREGNIPIEGAWLPGVPVPVTSRASTIAQKLLATADRGADRASESKDLIDLAFIAASWPKPELDKGLEMAGRAYSPASVHTGMRNALRLVDDGAYWAKCLSSLDVVNDGRLAAGLVALDRFFDPRHEPSWEPSGP